MTSPRTSTAGRVVPIVGAAVLAVASLAALALGVAALWGNGQRDRDGFVTTDREPVSTRSYALTTDDMTIDTGVPRWVLDSHDYSRVRLNVRSRDDKPVFVGIAPTAEVNRYLRG